ncbi:hypothetical protein RND81_06G118300 [Saponaria officinalis]|uniref:Uncharacterized protein n=1 Tax=Saponaria officinalis TaxID=3572 RepID=A0AAW1K553_SAPOF
MGSSSSSHLSSCIFFNNHLLNTILTLFLLIILYSPHFLIKLIIFPSLISTLILLFILKLGVSQQILLQHQQPKLETRSCFELEPLIGSDSNSGPGSKTDLESTLLTKEENDPTLQQQHQLELKTESCFELEPITNTGLGSKAELESTPLTKEENDPILLLLEQQHQQLELKTESCFELEPIIDSNSDLKPEVESTPLTKEENPTLQQQQLELKTESCFELEATTDTDSDSDSDSDLKPKVKEENDPAQPYSGESFVEWTVWGPLEVIYEEDEHDETQNDTVLYTDTDTGSSSWSLDEDEFEKIQRWEEEEEGMFEIALDYNGFCNKNDCFVMKKLRKEINGEVDEEDNLIEIDISPSKSENNEFSW